MPNSTGLPELDVPCGGPPRGCNAQAGEPCTSHSGTRPIRGRVHRVRGDAWRRARIEANAAAALVDAAAGEQRNMHAAAAAELLDQHGHTTEAQLVRDAIREQHGHLSAKRAVHLLLEHADTTAAATEREPYRDDVREVLGTAGWHENADGALIGPGGALWTETNTALDSGIEAPDRSWSVAFDSGVPALVIVAAARAADEGAMPFTDGNTAFRQVIAAPWPQPVVLSIGDARPLIGSYNGASVRRLPNREGVLVEPLLAFAYDRAQPVPELPPFFRPGQTYCDGTGYRAPELVTHFRVEHVTRHPDRGTLRAVGWTRTGAPGARWHGDFRDQHEFDGWTELPLETGGDS